MPRGARTAGDDDAASLWCHVSLWAPLLLLVRARLPAPAPPSTPPLSHDTYTRKQGCGGSVKLLETWDPRTVCHQAVTKCNSQMQLADATRRDRGFRARVAETENETPRPLAYTPGVGEGVQMCVCVHTCMHVCVCVRVHTHTHICIHRASSGPQGQ